jgi:hypothetical protein
MALAVHDLVWIRRDGSQDSLYVWKLGKGNTMREVVKTRLFDLERNLRHYKPPWCKIQDRSQVRDYVVSLAGTLTCGHEKSVCAISLPLAE